MRWGFWALGFGLFFEMIDSLLTKFDVAWSKE